MEPITGIGLILTLVQWLYSIRTTQKEHEDQDLVDDYFKWLASHNHKEILNAIKESEDNLNYVKGLIEDKQEDLLLMGRSIIENMQAQHSEIVEYLGDINKELKKLTGNVAIIDYLPGYNKISKEAKEILLEASKHYEEGLIFTYEFPPQYVVQVNVSTPNPKEFKGSFYIDAISELFSLDFITDTNENLYRITRPGYELAKKILEETKEREEN